MGFKSTVYLNRDNVFSKVLKKDGLPYPLTGITKVEIRFNGEYYNSADYPKAFTYPTAIIGEIVFKLGGLALPPRRDRDVELIVYSAENPNGLVWGTIDIDVVDIAI